MKLYQTTGGAIVEQGNAFYRLADQSWDDLLKHDDLLRFLEQKITGQKPVDLQPQSIRAPIGSQEVWAAGVTYYRSRDARMEESKSAGGGSFYDRVYSAERPELFFKSLGYRVVGTNQPVRIRRDSKWNVPEPELTLVISSSGKIVGFTIGNDMSSRDIEGENPLYLPQAKVYDGSCAMGPAILVTNDLLAKSTRIAISISRGGKPAFEGTTTLAELKRDPRELVEFLYRETSFPNGCFLMTGTGVVPPNSFTLAAGDSIAITIDGIGTLTNVVDSSPSPSGRGQG